MSLQEKIMIPPCLVDSDQISDSPGPYCMSFGFDPELYSRSIEKIGLVNTPLLIKNRSGYMDVISGYRRIQAVKALGWSRTPCRILPESTLSALECLLLNLYENLSTRVFNSVEKGMILKHLVEHLKEGEVIKNYMPLLGLPSHEETLRFYIRIEGELDVEIKSRLALGGLTLQAAKMLLDVDPESRLPICHLIIILKLNSNKQKQLIDNIVDISYMSGMSIYELIHKGPIEEICSDQKLNIPQKGDAVLRFLRSRRLPSLTTAESTFRKMISQLDLPNGVKINAPRFFEDPHYSLEVSFREGRELKDKIENLSRKEGLEILGDPWREDF